MYVQIKMYTQFRLALFIRGKNTQTVEYYVALKKNELLT